MGLFKRNDELFELMAKSKALKGGTPVTPGPTSGSTTRPVSSTFARAAAPTPLASDLFEVEGDALLVVEDEDWQEEPAAAGAPRDGDGVRTFSIRADTAVVGGILAGGLFLTAFFIGRTTANPEAKPGSSEVAVVMVEDAASPAPSVTTSPAGQSGGSATVPAGFPRNAATDPATASSPAEPEAPARDVKEGGYELVVVSTTPEKAGQVAEWLNTAPRSPIFGRSDLEAYTKGGTVKVRGFQQRESEVAARVKATTDPTGGSGTFHDAYFQKAR